MLTKSNVKNIYPLSGMQEGLFFHFLLDKHSSAYFVQFSYSIQGDLKSDLVEQSLNELMQRYDILRTVFVNNHDRLLQVVLKERRIDFAVFRMEQGASLEMKQAFIAHYRQKDRERSFDVTKDVLMRVTLLQLDTCEYELIWSFHHLLMDGWCLGLLAAEFMEMYRSLLYHRSAQLAKVAQYSTYIQWLQKRNQSESLDYWKRYLHAYAMATPLPKDVLHATAQPYKAARLACDLEEKQTEALNRLAARHQVTLNTIVQTVWGLLLARYNNTTDVVYGAVVSGRPFEIPDVETMIGLFINTIPIRIRLQGSLCFSELLKQVRLQAVESERHHYTPLTKIQGVSELKQHLFDHLLAFENYPVSLELSGTEHNGMPPFQISNLEVYEQTNYDFNLVVMPGDRLHLTVRYNENSFKPASVERILGHFQQVIDQILRDESVRLDDITILTAAETELLLHGFNDTDASYPSQKLLHQLFEEQALQQPTHTAVVCGDQRLSYAQLNQRANQLAHHLRAKGVRANLPVALLADRSLEMIIGLLAILKAGGGYVPIDPAYPSERIGFMLNDCQASLLLTTSSLTDHVRSPSIEQVYLDAAELWQGEDANLLPCNTAEDLAYIIYTSGTSGQPKGVLISHKNVVRLMVNDHFPFDFNSHDVWTMFHSYCFDFSVWEMYGALLYGGTLVVIPSLVAKDPEQYLALLRQEGVTVLNSTPAAFYALCEQEYRASRHDLRLRTIIFGGDALQPAKLQQWNALYPQTRLINMYGITETTVHVTFKEITPAEIAANSGNIGKPIPTLHVYVMDAQQRLLPLGSVGELCVGGAGVSQGYLNRDELTREKFVSNPYRPGEMLYRSGDLARWLPGGELEYLGRRDQQVKIRGYRIEVEEIVHHLLAFPSVQDAVVVCLPQEDGIASLVAYLVAPHPLTVAELRTYLAARLPDYMLPAFYVQLPRLPLSANGKLERHALPHPQGHALPATQEPVPARSQREAVLLAIWQQTLGTETIGIHDHFFTLGGDSIQALQISARLRKAGYHLPLRELFQAPTIAQLAPLLQPLQEEVQAASQEPVVGSVPLTPIQRWFFARKLPMAQHHHQAVLVRSRQRLEPEGLRAIFTCLQTHHDALRLTFASIEGQVVQYNQGPEMPLALHVVDLRHQEQELAACCTRLLEETDLAHGPLMQVVLFQLAEEDRLLMAVHHLAVDAVSWRILLEDLSSLLAQQRGGQPLALPAKTSSYRDWARQLEHYASSAKVQQDVAYWREVCQPWSARVQPHDPQAPNREQETSTLSTQLSREETEALLSRAHVAFGTQVQDLLLGGLALTMEQITGQQDLVVALEGHGREPIVAELDLSRTVGWFTTIYPLRLTLSKVEQEQELGRLVVEVKERLRRVPHKGLGYGVWRYLSGEAEREAFAVEPQILVNYLGQFEQESDERTGLSLAQESIGPLVSPLQERAAEWTVEAWVQEQHLHLTVSFNERRYEPEAMRAVLQTYEQQLRRLLTFCLAQTQPTLTPSDLTYKKLSMEQLKNFFA